MQFEDLQDLVQPRVPYQLHLEVLSPTFFFFFLISFILILPYLSILWLLLELAITHSHLIAFTHALPSNWNAPFFLTYNLILQISL